MLNRRSVLALTALYVLAGILGLAFNAARGFETGEAFAILIFAMYFGAGAIIALRMGGNVVGWILMVVGLGAAIGFASDQYSIFSYELAPAPLPLAPLAAWLATWVWILMMAGLALVLFVFPDGRLPSARWRIPLLLVIGLLGTALVSFAFGTAANAEHPAVRNPLFVPQLAALAKFVEDAFVLYLAGFGLGVASLIARYRRAGSEQRQQLKWIAVTTLFILLGLTTAEYLPELPIVDDVTWMLSMSALPVSIAISILRYRLYDIDVVIERTLVYGTLTAALGAIYFGAVIGAQTALGPITGGNEIAVAASTLLVIALFQPLRRRIQAAVDRRFYRSRYDATRTLDAFSARLRDEVYLDDVRAQLLGAVHATVQPRGASVWLRKRT